MIKRRVSGRSERERRVCALVQPPAHISGFGLTRPRLFRWGFSSVSEPSSPFSSKLESETPPGLLYSIDAGRSIRAWSHLAKASAGICSHAGDCIVWSGFQVHWRGWKMHGCSRVL